MPKHAEPKNQLLGYLKPAEYARLAPDLEPVSLSFKEGVYEPGKQIAHVYFVVSGVVSLVTALESGDIVETGTVGREGMAGIPIVLGRSVPTERAFCQVPGSALRMDAKRLLVHVEKSDALRNLLLRYANAVMVMGAQGAACNRAHNVEARMARWLLMTHDRVDGPEFPLTQEFLGQMLGVHRPAVNLAGTTLQRAGLIKYSRGKITVTDRPGLEAAACECYELITRAHQRVTR